MGRKYTHIAYHCAPLFLGNPLGVSSLCTLHPVSHFHSRLYSLYHFRLKHKVSVEQEISDIKLRFFTNISHDFRTPLTLVADPVEHLLADKTLSDDQHRMLLLVQRNVNILLRLVNQILDFRKYENGKMEYTPRSG